MQGCSRWCVGSCKRKPDLTTGRIQRGEATELEARVPSKSTRAVIPAKRSASRNPALCRDQRCAGFQRGNLETRHCWSGKAPWEARVSHPQSWPRAVGAPPAAPAGGTPVIPGKKCSWQPRAHPVIRAKSLSQVSRSSLASAAAWIPAHASLGRNDELSGFLQAKH